MTPSHCLITFSVLHCSAHARAPLLIFFCRSLSDKTRSMASISIFSFPTGTSNPFSPSIMISSDGKILILGGKTSSSPNGAKIYSINNTAVTYISDIYADNNKTQLNDYVYTISLTPDNKLLVLGGKFKEYSRIYGLNNTKEQKYDNK